MEIDLKALNEINEVSSILIGMKAKFNMCIIPDCTHERMNLKTFCEEHHQNWIKYYFEIFKEENPRIRRYKRKRIIKRIFHHHHYFHDESEG